MLGIDKCDGERRRFWSRLGGRTNQVDYAEFKERMAAELSHVKTSVAGREKPRSGGGGFAGVPVGQKMTILTDFGVESRLEKDDYLQGLKNLQKVW